MLVKYEIKKLSTSCLNQLKCRYPKEVWTTSLLPWDIQKRVLVGFHESYQLSQNSAERDVFRLPLLLRGLWWRFYRGFSSLGMQHGSIIFKCRHRESQWNVIAQIPLGRRSSRLPLQQGKSWPLFLEYIRSNSGVCAMWSNHELRSVHSNS